MADKVSSFQISFDADAGSISNVLAGIKSQFKSALSEIETSTKRVQLFGDIESKVKASAEALAAASTKAKDLAAQLDAVKAAGGKATPELTAGLKAANTELKSAENAYARQVDALTKLHVQLTRAKIDTSDLAAAQLKLAEASKVATAAANEQAARQLLGLKTIQDIQPQLQKISAAYETLRASGKLSSSEIATAQQLLQQKLRETNAEVTKLGGGLRGAGADAVSFFAGYGKALGAVAIVGTLTSALTAAVGAQRDLKQGIAEIGAVTNLTKEQLAELAAGARQLAVTIGFDLNQGIKALFELIRSGVPPENALEVLRISAEAAKASLSDIGTTAKISGLLIDGFGLEVGDLRGAFDALVQGSKDGGATLKEFAESAGPLLNVARSLKVPFNDVVAVLTVMTDASNDASGSAAALTKILIKLGDPEVRGKLRELGITSTNVLEIFKQLGDKGIPLQRFIDLGIASTKTAAGIAALTNNAGKLAPELDKIAKSAGAVAAANAALYDSPAARSSRLNAALHETALRFGSLTNFVEKLGIGVGTDLLEAFNILTGALQRNAPVADAAATAADALAAANKRAGEAARAAAKDQDDANAQIATSSAALLVSIKALQDAANRDLADINARADAEIAALDRSTKATATTAAAIIAIQTKQAADRLAIIQKNEKDILTAVDLAAAAQKKSATETAAARIAALAPVLKSYQDHYASLVALAQQYQSKINSIGQERDSFTEDIRKRTAALNEEGLSALGKYAANLKEIDRLIEASAVAAANGETSRARALTDEAIARSALIKQVINADGNVVIGKYEAIATATNKTKKAEDSYLGSLDKQDDLAKQGFDAASKGIAEVLPKLQELQGTYDAIKTTIADGLSIKVETDEASIRDATRIIDDLTKPRVVPIILQTQQGGDATPVPVPAEGFARGGPVGDVPRLSWPAVQAFAAGGSVFRRPLWNKVPGTGSGDTVPALLGEGSFVMRKAAVGKYGDTLMARLARGYATGGPVSPDVERWKQLHLQKTLAETEFSKILDHASGLPHTNVGQDVRDYVKRVLELIRASQDQKEIQSLLDRVLVYYDSFKGGLDDAQRWHVPLVLGALASDDPVGKTKPGSAFERLQASKRFAAGGGTTDTVPAYLTPGEYVLNRSVAGMFGADLLNAINRMAVPKAALSHMLNFAPPRPHSGAVARFADGGPVGSVPRAGSAGASSKVGDVHFNIYAQSVDEKTVRRDVIPLIDKVFKRSR